MPLILNAKCHTTQSSTNADLTHTIAKPSNCNVYLIGYKLVLDGSSSTQKITVQILDGSTGIYKDVIATDSPIGAESSLFLSFPLAITDNLVLTASAAGGGTYFNSNVFYLLE